MISLVSNGPEYGVSPLVVREVSNEETSGEEIFFLRACKNDLLSIRAVLERELLILQLKYNNKFQ